MTVRLQNFYYHLYNSCKLNSTVPKSCQNKDFQIHSSPYQEIQKSSYQKNQENKTCSSKYFHYCLKYKMYCQPIADPHSHDSSQTSIFQYLFSCPGKFYTAILLHHLLQIYSCLEHNKLYLNFHLILSEG